MRFPFFKTGADKPITIETPEDVPCSSVVFVPGDAPELDDDAINKMTTAWVDQHTADPLKELIKLWCQLPMMQVRLGENDQLGRQLYEDTKQCGYTKEEALTVCEAPRAYVITGRDPLVPPRTGMWAVLCTALAVAELPGAVMLDGDRTKPWNKKLTFAQLQWNGIPRIKEFILVPYSQREDGLFWFTTRGIGRFGLPEIQVEDVPAMEVQSLVRAICGIAQQLADLLMTKVAESGKLLKMVQFGPELVLEHNMFLLANGRDPVEPDQQSEGFPFRLSLRPSKAGGDYQYLTLIPPTSWKGQYSHWLSALALHFDIDAKPTHPALQQISVDDPLLAQVKKAAQADLPRFIELYHQQPPDTFFSIKVPVTESNRTEHIWMDITRIESDQIVGRLQNDPVELTTLKCGDETTTTRDAVEDLIVWDIKAHQIILGGHHMKTFPADE